MNPTWQSSRWLISSSWIRMNEFESDWTSLSQSFVQNGWIQDGRSSRWDAIFKISEQSLSLSEIELVWVRVRVEGECFWVNLREDNNVSKSKMAMSESNMAEFKMAGNIKLSQNEQVNFFLCKMAVSKIAEFKMAAIINLSENEQVKFFFVQNGWIHDGRSTRWLPSSSSVRMNQFESDWIRLSQSFVQHGWIQDGRIQDGCHLLFSQIELVWVRVRLEGECFWVNLREDNKVSWIQNGSVWIQHGRVQDGCHHQVESEWMSDSYFSAK